MSIDREAVQRVIDLLAETGAAEIEIEDGDMTVRVVRGSAGVTAADPEQIEVTESDGTPVPTEPADPVAETEEQVEYVTAGLVGLFHRGRAPDEQPMAQVGEEVEEGQVIATIEALRKLTDVVAPCDGVIEEFLVADGEAVQYGDRLFGVRVEATSNDG